MNYDLYIAKPEGDIPTQLRLLVTEQDSANAAKQFVQFVHGKGSQFDKFINQEYQRLQLLGLLPALPDVALLPLASWFLQFTFTLAKPWISKDDDPFYVADSVNPVHKDKVFKVPFMAASSWKGLLRWTLMHTRLAQRKDELTPKRFAQERFVQALLFGDEQGEEPAGVKGFAKYINSLSPEGARAEYEHLLRQHYSNIEREEPEEEKVFPHHSGCLYFYPTFFDAIDVEVINPHSRKTRAGTQPIYLESVPAGASGTFSLLYIPFNLIGQPEDEIRKQATEDLRLVSEGLRAMFTTYGFGAKTSSGFGLAEDGVHDGTLALNIPDVVFSQDDAPQVQKPDDEFQKYLDETGQVKAVFKGGGEGGLLSNSEYKQSGEQGGGGSLSEFKQFRNWYSQFGEEWQANLQTAVAETTYPAGSFKSLSDLAALCRNLELKTDSTTGGAP